MNIKCGIAGIGLYFPDRVRKYTEIAELSGVPEEVVRDKFGINQVYCPGEQDQTSDMAVWAANNCLKKSKVNPLEIDMVIYFGENHSDYTIYSIAPKVINDIGAINAWGYDVECKCGSFIIGLEQAKMYMMCNNDVNTVLLAGGYRNIDKVNYRDTTLSFLFDVSCAGAAVLLKKNSTEHLILDSASIADGRFAESIFVPGGGTKIPFTKENVQNESLHHFFLSDPEKFRNELGAISLPNLVKVTNEACKKSGISVSDIDFMCPLHMKVSAHRQLLNDLNITAEKSFYLSDFGHCGQLDGAISLCKASDAGLIKKGDMVAIIAMGFGYVWNACILRW